MTQTLYQTAMKFAGERHANQQVPGTTANYLLHLSNVAMEVLIAYQHQPDFDLDLAVQLAILHDVVEDTDTTVEEVRELFGEAVATGVAALSKDSSLPDKASMMADSLRRINQTSREAGIVKLADRITNLQPPPAHWSNEKCQAYLDQARIIARELQSKHGYLEQRLAEKMEGYPGNGGMGREGIGV